MLYHLKLNKTQNNYLIVYFQYPIKKQMKDFLYKSSKIILFIKILLIWKFNLQYLVFCV